MNLPRRPVKPDPQECCGRHCEPCVMDYYELALERWEERVRKLGVDPSTLPAEE